MGKCISCDEYYPDQLRRCPYCGETPDGTDPAQGFSVHPPVRGLRRRRRRRTDRLVWLGVLGAAVIALVAVVAWPGRGEREGDATITEPILGHGMWDEAPIGLVTEIEPGAITESFLVESARVFRGKALVTGTCSPEAVARVFVDGSPATIHPGADRWTALVELDDAIVHVVAEGVGGDRTEARVPVETPGVPPGEVHLLSHADGATVHDGSLTLRLWGEAGTLSRDVPLTAVENRLSFEGRTFTIYRTPEGLVFLRVSAQGAYVFLREIDGQEMVLVPGGLSLRGTGEDSPHGPRHVVRVSPYLIDRAEVTCRQYASFLQYMRRTRDGSMRYPEDPGVDLRPAGWKSDEAPEGREDLPVTGVDWFSAFAYARWAGGRLPTETEWERAAAGPLGRAYPWGDAFEAACCRTAADGPLPANSLPASQGPYGLLHASGNVREWCADRYGPRWYLRGTRTNPRGPSRTHHRVVRGGSFASPVDTLRLQFREHADPNVRTKDLGFRVAWRWIDFEGR